MFLEYIKLINFRNYENTEIRISKNTNIFYGNNAQGKTNIIESIYYLFLSKSFRDIKDEDLIYKEKKSFKLEGKLYNKDKFSIKFANNLKKYFIDGNQIKKMGEYISRVNVISFTPDDIEILKGLPEIRRKYFDSELSQLYNAYYKVLLDYKKILKMRNDILKNIKDSKNYDLNYFNILTEYLINKSIFIYRARKKYIDKINNEVNNIYKNIINIEGFNIEYENQLCTEEYSEQNLKIILSNMFKDNFYKEKEAGNTLYGPHRDNYRFLIKDKDLKIYGSQGQQKLAILSLKLTEMIIFNNKTGKYPILLLDDLFSEFDREKINNILKYINNSMQVIITATDIRNIKKSILNNAKLFYIENGSIMEI